MSINIRPLSYYKLDGEQNDVNIFETMRANAPAFSFFERLNNHKPGLMIVVDNNEL